jgi:hypothetical protein
MLHDDASPSFRAKLGTAKNRRLLPMDPRGRGFARPGSYHLISHVVLCGMSIALMLNRRELICGEAGDRRVSITIKRASPMHALASMLASSSSC